MIKIKKGLKLPIAGEPRQRISEGNSVGSVALVGSDYKGMKPTMLVGMGDRVKLGQPLFSDKKNPGAIFCSPGAGRVSAINRGAKRTLQSVVIELEGEGEERFEFVEETKLEELSGERIRETMVKSGHWIAFRTRPFSKTPEPDAVPHSIFVNAMDTNPLAADPSVVLNEYRAEFTNGIKILSKLTEGRIYLCTASGANVPGIDSRFVVRKEFEGVHPAGLSGTHIHFVDPVHAKKTVWTINYQDVVAVGHLFTTGRIKTDRIVSLAGPEVEKPRLVKTRLGACLNDLVRGEISRKENRIVSGSVLSGFKADGPFVYLGRFHQQVSVLEEGRRRQFLGWLGMGLDKFSVKSVYLSKLFPKRRFGFTTSLEGSRRAMVPIGMYEKVMPLDIQPTFLLRSLIVGDTDQAQALGCLELDEEDLGLCTFVCPGKYNYGSILRANLTKIEREG